MSEHLAIFSVIALRDLKLAFRNKAELLNPLVFFVMVIILFPLALGSNEGLLRQLTPGLIWDNGPAVHLPVAGQSVPVGL